MICLILSLFLILFILKLFYDYNDNTLVKSSIDQNTYLIRNKYHSKQLELETANTLAEINQRIQLLIKHISQPNEPHYIKHLRNTYSNSSISEAAIDDNYTTFTINKKDMHICLRSRDHHKKLYDINDLMYVVIHELAHMANYDLDGNPINGHEKQFQEIFKYLIKESITLGIYKYHNYNQEPKNYCGMTITSHILN